MGEGENFLFACFNVPIEEMEAEATPEYLFPQVPLYNPSLKETHEKYIPSMLGREEEKQLEKHPPPSNWRHIL